ncbi:MAG: hypothetical protein MHMPM18_002531 [Marteilia pararefringens]
MTNLKIGRDPNSLKSFLVTANSELLANLRRTTEVTCLSFSKLCGWSGDLQLWLSDVDSMSFSLHRTTNRRRAAALAFTVWMLFSVLYNTENTLVSSSNQVEDAQDNSEPHQQLDPNSNEPQSSESQASDKDRSSETKSKGSSKRSKKSANKILLRNVQEYEISGSDQKCLSTSLRDGSSLKVIFHTLSKEPITVEATSGSMVVHNVTDSSGDFTFTPGAGQFIELCFSQPQKNQGRVRWRRPLNVVVQYIFEDSRMGKMSKSVQKRNDYLVQLEKTFSYLTEEHLFASKQLNSVRQEIKKSEDKVFWITGLTQLIIFAYTVCFLYAFFQLFKHRTSS